MISIIIPIYNEEENLLKLQERLDAVCSQWDESYEIILVNDGSKDNSLSIMRSLVDRDSHYKVLTLSRNYGHQAAISAGLTHVEGDTIAIMDGDLQDPPEEIDRFVKKLRSGYDVVYAVRIKRKEGIFKRIAYAVFYRLLSLISDIDIPLDSGDFSVFNKKVLDALNNHLPEKIRFVRGLRAYVGFRQTGMEYMRDERHAGKSKYTFGKLLKLAFDGLFDFSVFPLRIASYLGFFIAFSAFFVGIFFIFHRIIGFKVFGHIPIENPGLATTVVGIFFLSGVILIILGIIGEYVGRIYFEVKRRPFFIVDEIYQK